MKHLEVMIGQSPKSWVQGKLWLSRPHKWLLCTKYLETMVSKVIHLSNLEEDFLQWPPQCNKRKSKFAAGDCVTYQISPQVLNHQMTQKTHWTMKITSESKQPIFHHGKKKSCAKSFTKIPVCCSWGVHGWIGWAKDQTIQGLRFEGPKVSKYC